MSEKNIKARLVKLKQSMRFWFSKMLWSKHQGRNTLKHQGERVKEPSRELIQCLISERPFSQKNKTKQKLQFCKIKQFHTQASWNIQIKVYKRDPQRSSIYVRKVTVETNKRIRDEPEGHLNLVARYYMLRTAFCGYSKGNWRNFPVVSNPRVEKEFDLYE